MATRIQATPILNRQESRRFSSLVEKNLTHMTGRLPTPKLRKAMKMVIQNGNG